VKKVAIFEATDWETNQLRKVKIPNTKLSFFKEELTDKTVALAKDYDIVSVFIYSALTKTVLLKLKKLKLIATRSTGFDHIDVKFCGKKNINVSNVPFYGENTVAEHTFALILAISRNIHKAYLRTMRGDYRLDGLMGFDLKGKTIGVIGGGHIGLHVVRMAKGFGMEVKTFDVKQNSFLSEVLDFEYTSLEELLKSSDIITLHAPYTPKTHHLINKENIKIIKKGAILINTARGGLVETGALLEALDRKIISGVGLDVLEGEELIKEENQLLSHKYPPEKMETLLKSNILLHREDVVFTPHIAFYSREAIQRILDTTVDNIQNFVHGSSVNNVLIKNEKKRR